MAMIRAGGMLNQQTRVISASAGGGESPQQPQEKVDEGRAKIMEGTGYVHVRSEGTRSCWLYRLELDRNHVRHCLSL